MEENFKTLAVDLEEADYWIAKAATLNAMEISTDSAWQSEGGFNGWLLYILGLNPVKGVYNLLKHGQYSSEASGSFEVTTNQPYYEHLRTMCLRDFRSAFIRESQRGPEAAMTYIESKKQGAIRSWDNLQHRFSSARSVNDAVRRELNQTIDNVYRIQVAAAVGVCVLGALPASALGTTVITLGSTSACTIPATFWTATGISAAYAFTTELVCSPADVRKASAVGYKINPATAAGLTSAASNVGQQAAQFTLTYKAREAMKAAAGQYMGTELFNRVSTEGYRQLQRSHAAKAVERANATSSTAAKGISGVAIGVGLWMMKDDILAAIRGVTADER